jgi:hypothetical protein
MILVIAELCLPVLAILYLHRLYKAREEMLKNIKGFYIVSGILLFFLLLMTMIPGTFNTFLSAGELNSLESITDPAQYETMSQYYENIELVRSSIFTADVWRSILFLVLGIAVIFAYIKKFINIIPLTGILALLILADLASVNRRYLGVESKGKGYKQWAENYKYKYPFAAGDGETAIYNMETAANPAIMASCDSAMNVMKSTFDKDLKGKEKTRMLDWAKYRTFNRLTNFRVLEEGNPFNSSYASYFFKSLGGYHGAKLGRYQELIEYHLGFRNPSVLDMLNMKYSVIPKRDKAGEIIGSQLGSVNPNAMGNVWFAKDIKVVENADEEIVAMDAFRAYEIDAIGNYPVVIDGQISQGTKVVRGQESIGFIDVNLNSGFPPKLDTFAIQVPFQAIEGDMELCLIKDSVQGLNWAYNNMIDSTFDRVLVVSGTGIQGWDVHTTTVVDKRYKENISKDSYSGEGSINQVSYHPDHLVYRSSSSEDQLAVFSEIHYPIGWTAYLDGSEVPISRVNYVLRAIEVPAGDHKIEFVFESETYNSSGVMAWSATILILVLIAFGVYKEKDHKEEEESLEKEIEGEQSVSVE